MLYAYTALVSFLFLFLLTVEIFLLVMYRAATSYYKKKKKKKGGGGGGILRYIRIIIIRLSLRSLVVQL